MTYAQAKKKYPDAIQLRVTLANSNDPVGQEGMVSLLGLREPHKVIFYAKGKMTERIIVSKSAASREQPC